MGLPADTAASGVRYREQDTGQGPVWPALPSLIEEAKDKRYDLKASQTQLQVAEDSLRALKRANMATISATTSMNVGNNSINPFNRSGTTRNQAIGVTVSIPIFTGFSQIYSERAAEKSLEAQKEQLHGSELTVEQDVWNAWHNYDTAKQSWLTSQDQLASALQLKGVALGRYKEGLGTILDVLNAQLQYSNALQSVLQTRYSLLTSRVALVQSVGVLNLETMQPESVAGTASDYNIRSNNNYGHP